jgi:hypothetical protein
MANRSSEPAPAPPPAKAEPAPAPVAAKPAPKQGIPSFAEDNAETEPVALAWNDYDAEDGGGMPTGDQRPGLEGTSVEGVGRPVKGKKTNVNVAGTDAEGDPDVHLDANTAEGDEATAATEGTDAEEDAPKLTGSERRRAALAALEREQQTRAIETNLIAERSRREELEGKLKNASLGELLAMRGMRRDDALESLIAGKEGKPPEELTPEQKREAQRDADIEALKKDRDTRDKEISRLQRQENMGRVVTATQAIESVPVVHAAMKSGVIVDHDEKTGAPLTAAEWIGGLAEAEWTKAGSPAGKQKAYLKAAAEVLEDKLIADHSAITEAIAAKQGGTTRREPPAPPRPPSLRRPAARPDARPKPLPRDRDALDIELKRRFNLR